MTLGVSVVVCCHNSTKRLPQTLAHLVAQQVREGLQWEVIIVNNASSDDTARVASTCWPASAPAPLRVVYEPQLGLSHARCRGLAEAKYEVVSFVDDDNWVCSDWVQLVSDIMSQHPDVGACGGVIDAVCMIDPPSWFERYKGSYAVGPQGQEAGDVTCTRGSLWGVTIRKLAWQQLVEEGFRSVLTGRRGRSLKAGDDTELCFALRLAGWRLWYEPRLRMRHFLPANRLEWRHLRRLHRGFGASTAGLDPYSYALRGHLEGSIEPVRPLDLTWDRQAMDSLRRLLRYRGKLVRSFFLALEGDPEALFIEGRIGRVTELLRRRKAYDLSFRGVSEGTWRRVSCLPDKNVPDDYFAIREPKHFGGVRYSERIISKIITGLNSYGYGVEDYRIDVDDYWTYFKRAEYTSEYPQYDSFNIYEKSLEHYIASKLLNLGPNDIYVEIGSEGSPAPEIYSRLCGCTTYKQDISYPRGVNDNTIGGDPWAIPIPDNLASKMALFDSFEHFEGNSDIRLIRESGRVLRPGGAVCIIPFYLFDKYVIQTDPSVSVPAKVQFERDAIVYCDPMWKNRHGRFYDPSHLIKRVHRNLNGLTMTIYRITNAKEVHKSCYVEFAALITKPTNVGWTG